MKEREIKRAVKEGYASIAKQATSYYSSRGCSCCGSPGIPEEVSKRMGYSAEEISAAPPESNLGLGCGNPVALASLNTGEVVLDMGAGAGFDCFLASSRVGPSGMVIGVDITSEMVDRARTNARKGGYSNIDFRQGDLENMPVADNYVDVVISNCVINLSPDKPQALREAHRVLRPGGRFAVSDVVLTRSLPGAVQRLVELWAGCVVGALTADEYRTHLEGAGFVDVEIVPTLVHDRAALEGFVAGIDVEAVAGRDRDELLAELDGTIMNAFVRARRPH